MDITYRPAQGSDYEELITLYGSFVGQPERYLGKDNDSFQQVINSPTAHLILALSGDQIVGFVAFSSRRVFRYPRPIVEVEEIYVHPVHRRKGIATELMNLVEQSPEGKLAYYVFLASDKKRTEAHAFYRKLGYDEYAFHFRRRV